MSSWCNVAIGYTEEVVSNYLVTTSQKSVSRLGASISQHMVFTKPLNGLARLWPAIAFISLYKHQTLNILAHYFKHC